MEPSQTFKAFKAAVETTGISSDLLAQSSPEELSRLADASLAAQYRVFNPNRGAPAESTARLIDSIEALREQPLSSLDRVKGLREFVVSTEDEAIAASRTLAVSQEQELRRGKRLLLQQAQRMTRTPCTPFMSRISTGTILLEDPSGRTANMDRLMEAGPFSNTQRALFNATQYLRFIRWRFEEPAEWAEYLLNPRVRKHIEKERCSLLQFDDYDQRVNPIFCSAVMARSTTWNNFINGTRPFASPGMVDAILRQSGFLVSDSDQIPPQLREAALLDGIWGSRLGRGEARLELLKEFEDYICEFEVEVTEDDESHLARVCLIDDLTCRIAGRPVIVSELLERFPPAKDLSRFLPPLTETSTGELCRHRSWANRFLGSPHSDPSLPQSFRDQVSGVPELARESLNCQRRLLAAAEFKREGLGRAVAHYVGNGEVDLTSVSAGNYLPNGKHRVFGALIDTISAAAEFAHIVDDKYRRQLGKLLPFASIRDGSLTTYTLAIDAEHLCRSLDANRAAWLLTWDRKNPELLRVCGRILGFESGGLKSELPEQDIEMINPCDLPRE